MKVITAIALLLLPLCAWADFFTDTDIPMMDDMVVNENDTFSFDTPAGQIMSISCKTNSSVQDVKNFYKETLLALGWQTKSATEYAREQDKLSLKIIPTTKGTKLQLQLTYKNK